VSNSFIGSVRFPTREMKHQIVLAALIAISSGWWSFSSFLLPQFEFSSIKIEMREDNFQMSQLPNMFRRRKVWR
jgi:hypothetical protein